MIQPHNEAVNNARGGGAVPLPPWKAPSSVASLKVSFIDSNDTSISFLIDPLFVALPVNFNVNDLLFINTSFKFYNLPCHKG